MLRTAAGTLGVLVALLAFAGLFVDGQLLLGFANVDIALDVLRIVTSAALLYAGFGPASVDSLRSVLIAVGGAFVLVGASALSRPALLGLAPTGLTRFDIAFSIIAGAGCLGLALLTARHRVAESARPLASH